MSEIFFTSDWHFCHDKPFIYESRHFSDIESMNESIVENYNSLVSQNDTVYCLGDCMLVNDAAALAYIRRLHGNIKLVLGNHDTAARIKKYSELPNIEILGYAYMLKLTKTKNAFLCHYPTLCDNGDNKVFSLHGHTHSEYCFETVDAESDRWTLNVGVDAWNCCPVHIDQVIDSIQKGPWTK